MDLELEDKVCVVTGASKGIGLAVTRALVAEGTVLVAGARTGRKPAWHRARHVCCCELGAAGTLGLLVFAAKFSREQAASEWAPDE